MYDVVENEEFQDSLLGKIPKDWNLVGIENFVHPIDGIKPGPFGSNITKSNYTSSGYRVYGQEQVIAGDLSIGDYFISKSKYQELRSFAVQENDILLSLVGTTGKVLVVRNPFHPGVINPRLVRLRPDKNSTNVEYFKYLLESSIVRYQLNRVAQGGTMEVLSATVLRRLYLPKPELWEQQRIAEILEKVDNAIAHTASLISKLKQIKAGLLHDLLTRGLDENGQLRNPDTHPEQFQDSPLGIIPKDWDIYQTGAFASIKYGINDAVDQSLESGVYTITLPCVTKAGELLLEKQYLAFSARYKVSKDDILQPGDLLFNWRNGSQEHLGKTAYFDSQDEYTHVGFLLRIRTNSEICDSRYFWWRISYMKSEGFFLKAKSQVNNTFNSEELANMPVIVPPLTEQKKIVDTIEPCEKRIRKEEAYLNKLKLQKQGLMQDLLTGKIRVKNQ